MSMVKTRRAAVVEQVQQLGVVAVIRIKDPGKLRAVVDALAEGGVRALEVTMTVPGAVGLIRELAPTLPPEFLLGRGDRHRPPRRRGRSSTPGRPTFVVSRCSGRR